MANPLLDELRAAGCDIDHYATDLFVRVSDTATAIIKRHEAAGLITNRTTFSDNIEGLRWYDLPFHYHA